ncbi:MAG: inosine/xanthosine triphosphatase [Chloroflexota bacterium]
MKTLIVASTNPVKIAATLEGFRRMFPDESFEARGISVPSGVSDQPMTDAETLQGALNRLANVRATSPEADYWVGIEGGVEDVAGILECFAWAVASDGVRVGKSRTATFSLPEEAARLVWQGMELGHADDVVFGRSNSKQQNGSVGLLTGDVVDRTAYYLQAVILALIPFKNLTLTFGQT